MPKCSKLSRGLTVRKAWEIFSNFCGEAILILNVEPRALNAQTKAIYWRISDTILSVFFHFRTTRCVVLREVADREVVNREVVDREVEE